jgi:predicted ferric reductase
MEVWHLIRSTGTVAYVLLSGSTIWGLLASSRIAREQLPAALAVAIHNSLSWLAIVLAASHAILLLFDDYVRYRLADLLLPFSGPYRPLAVGLGIISLYLAAVVAASFLLRKRLGQKWWRRLHYLTFAAYLLATAHGLTAGTDAARSGMEVLYAGSGLTVLFLTNYRLLTGRPATRVGGSARITPLPARKESPG